jgi:hypothetical protein
MEKKQYKQSGEYSRDDKGPKKQTPRTTPQAELMKAILLLAALIFLLFFMRSGGIQQANTDQSLPSTTGE